MQHVYTVILRLYSVVSILHIVLSVESAVGIIGRKFRSSLI